MDKTTQTPNLDISTCNVTSDGTVPSEGKVVTDPPADVASTDPTSSVTAKPDEDIPLPTVRSTEMPDSAASAAVALTELKTESSPETVEHVFSATIPSVHPTPVKSEGTVPSTPIEKIKTDNVNDVSPESVVEETSPDSLSSNATNPKPNAEDTVAAVTTPSKVKAKVCIMSDRKFVLKLLTHTHHEFFISLRRRNIPSLTKHLPVSPRPNRQKCLVARSAPWNLMNLILSLIGPLWSILLQGPSGNSK